MEEGKVEVDMYNGKSALNTISCTVLLGPPSGGKTWTAIQDTNRFTNMSASTDLLGLASPVEGPVEVSSRERAMTERSPYSEGIEDQAVAGQCLARLSARSLFAKDWKPCHWVIRKGRLWLYRCKADYEQNPAATGMKKDVALGERIRVADVKYKSYGEHGGLHHFTLEEVVDGSASVLAKFASKEREEVVTFHDALMAAAEAEKQRRIRYSRMTVSNAVERQMIVDEVVLKETTERSANK